MPSQCIGKEGRRKLLRLTKLSRILYITSEVLPTLIRSGVLRNASEVSPDQASQALVIFIPLLKTRWIKPKSPSDFIISTSLKTCWIKLISPDKLHQRHIPAILRNTRQNIRIIIVRDIFRVISSRRMMACPTEIHIPITRFDDKHPIPERTIVSERRVPVIYYLSRNGQLVQPHFMEVPLSSPDGRLFLSDVINRLNLLRGRGMASMYSWSSKRSYKSGFVWHDLAGNDFIHPSHGTEYVLKGSEILESPVPSRPLESVSFRCLKPSETDFPVVVRRRNQSWTSIDLGEYRVYKTESSSELNLKVAADAATQTVDKRRRRRLVREKEDELVRVQEKDCGETKQNPPNLRTELSQEEISPPPPSDSSPETLETLMQAEKQLMLGSLKEDENDPTAASNSHCVRLKASTVLMQLISCGSLSFRDCRATYIEDQLGSKVGEHKAEPAILGRPRDGNSKGQISGDVWRLKGIKSADKEYLIEIKKEEVPSLKEIQFI